MDNIVLCQKKIKNMTSMIKITELNQLICNNHMPHIN